MNRIERVNTINKVELKEFFEQAFSELDPEDQKNMTGSQQDLEDWFLIDELENYSKYGSLIEVRDEEGKLVGALFVGRQHPLSWPDGKKAEIFVLAVRNSDREKGIATQLMQEAEKAAKEMGAKTLVLNTHKGLLSSQNLYQKLGYKQIGTLEGYYDNGDAVFFAKNL